MKGGFAAVALAALASGVTAAHHRHAHEALFKKSLNQTNEICTPGCTTIWKTITGEPTLIHHVTKTKTVTAVSTSTKAAPPPPPPTTQAPPPPPATTEIVVVPTPLPRTCPTPGTYTFPATTITVSKTTTVCAPASTQVPPGTHTVGGVTTVVVTATTVTCPVATVTTSNGVTTSTIVQTTYVCPSSGTYTIAPITTTVSEHTVIVFPTPSVCNPGTYTAPSQVVTVTKTGYVTYCPFTSKGLPTTTPAPAPAPVKSQAPPPPPPVVKSSAPPPPPPAKTSEAPKSSPPQQSAPPAVSKGLTSSNDQFGITYTPYNPKTGQCKSSSEVERDIKIIKEGGFQNIRVYSTDCSTLENVGGACKKHGVSMILGVFVKATGCTAETPDIKEQIDKLAAFPNWDLVKLVVVGNEAIMNGFCTPQQLKTLITTVKSKCGGKYNGPYTISETLNIWERHDVSSTICPAVGVTGANIHAYFNSGIAPSKAGDFVQSQLDILSKICPGNEVINLECGYPNGGNANGLAIPGSSQQAQAIKSIRQKVGYKTVFFSYENDLWKAAGTCDCEDKWGVIKNFLDVGLSASLNLN
ncbi:hypothetical protein QQS21_009975 [Conoideocrella luteorostrata]|uniref:Probable beta-glucosidase btgE n=1 Tax=Conoideocrella luteorostrata TaxID=1105319 RepID=A0AAJ0FPV1_9HYPO|nr:hypothetical protein QQS21_009975 [Conoideocrella luteorostrata]